MSRPVDPGASSWITTRRVVLFLSALVFIFSAVHLNAAASSLSFYLILLPIFFAKLHHSFLSRLEFKRRAAAGQYEQQEAPVEIILRSGSDLPVYLPEIEDYFGPQKNPDRRTIHPGWLTPFGRLTARYTGTTSSGRGEYVIGPAIVRVTDPLDLSTATRVFDQSDLMTVYPKTFHIRRMPFEAARSRFSMLITSTTKASLGQEFYGVRDYRRGDSTRHIHWRSTARHGRLIVKEFQMPSSKNVYLFLDLNERTGRGMGRRSSVDFTARIAASVADYAIRSNHQVGLYADAQTGIGLPPAGGLAQMARIMRMLVAAKQQGKLPFDELLVRHLGAIQLDSAVVLIFPTAHVELGRYLDAFSILLSRNVRVSAVLIDDSSFYRVTGESDEIAEGSMERLESSLSALGVTVYPIREKSNMETVFAQVGDGARA